MRGETQAGSAGVWDAGHLWRSGRYKAEREHRGHGGGDGEYGVGVGEPLDRGGAGETGGGDGGGHRDTDGGTELVEGVDDARYQPGLVQADAAEGGGGRGDEQWAAAQREHRDAGKGFGVEVAVCRQADEQCVADGDQGQGDDGDGTGADGADQAAGRDGSDHQGQGRGQEEQAGLERAEAAKVLQVLRTKKEVRDEHAGRDKLQKGAGRDRTARQQVQAQQGRRYGAFDDHEHAVQDEGGHDGQERAELR